MYNGGQQVSITATPGSGYVFSSWSANPSTAATLGNASAANTTATIKGTGTITATFTQATPTPSPTPTASLSPNPTTQPTPTPTAIAIPSPTPNPSPTPIPTSIIISATTNNGSKVNFTAYGDLAASTILSATITTDPASKTTISLDLVAQSTISGFCNLTIPKNELPHGTTTPTIYVNSQEALAQGCKQDAKNYYLWYTTYYTAYELQIMFAAKSATTQFPIWILLAIAIVGIISILAVLLPKKLAKKSLSRFFNFKKFISGDKVTSEDSNS